MAKAPNLWKRHRTYFLRLSVPPTLRHHFGGRDKIVESLHTDSQSEAEIRRDRLVAEYRARFQRLRAGADPTPAEVAAAVGHVTPARSGYKTPPERRQAIDQLIVEVIENQAAAEIQTAAEKLGITIERGSPLWREIGEKILRARMAAGHKAMLVRADWSDEDGPAPASPPVEPVAPPPALPVDHNGETFSQAFEAHIRKIESEGTRATTIASYRQKAAVFQVWCKDAPLRSITRAMASDFLDHISQGRTNSTRNQYAALLSAVFETAKKRGRFSGDNGFQDQKRKAEPKSYPQYTPAELSKLFAAATFETDLKEHNTKSAVAWAAAIACYSGMRREEVAQLRASDLQKIDGVWRFDVTPEAAEAGGLKTKSSRRVVPVHSALIKAGLLKYHANVPADGRLFPGLKGRKSKGGKLGPALGDAFEKWRKGLGITRAGLCFHSFRGNVATALDRAHVAESDIRRILGHEIEGMSLGKYSHGPGLKRLAKEVDKIAYPGVKLG